MALSFGFCRREHWTDSGQPLLIYIFFVAAIGNRRSVVVVLSRPVIDAAYAGLAYD